MLLKIYYLDDEPILCENFFETFSSPDISIETFQDAGSLIERCKNLEPDLIFIDYRLPGMNGDEVALKLNTKVPKVLVTGDLDVKTIYKFISILEKPAKDSEIISIIEKITAAKA